MSYYFCKVQNYGHEPRITIYYSIVSCKRIDPITAKKLIAHFGSEEAFFMKGYRHLKNSKYWRFPSTRN